jgi:hypothetical protein
MPCRLVCTRDRTRGTYRFTKTRDGAFLARVLASPLSLDSHFAKCAKELKVPVVIIHRMQLEMGDSDTYELDPEAPPAPPVRVVGKVDYRTRNIAGKTVETFATFGEALQGPGEVIEWDGRAATCALDLDFHGGEAPPSHDLRMHATRLAPQPSTYWITRSGGLRCIYHACEAFDAEELAACAAIPLSLAYPDATIELLSRTRKPPGEVFSCVQTTQIPLSFGTRLTAESSSISTWLIERGFTIGERYPHSQCPKNPSERARGNSNPVVVRDDRIHCYICEADGRGGHWSFAALAGEREQTQFKMCVDNLTHWGHARFIVEQVIQNPKIAKTVYRAALRMRHGDDPRIPCIFTVGEPVGLLRFDGHWGTSEGEPLGLTVASRTLSSLPAAQRVEEGEVRVCADKVELMSQGIDLAKMGYPALVVVWGAQVTRHQTPPPNRVFVRLNSPALRNDAMSDRRPVYLAPGARMLEEDAWQTIERAYPGANRKAIELLIVAKGCAEHRAGLTPMLFFTGPTGAGKTGSVSLAAAICGDSVGTVPFTPNVERLRAGLFTAKKCGTFAMFDEFLKGASGSKASPVEAMETALTFTENSLSHVLYVGPVPLGDLPVCIWGDTAVPPELQSHAQLGRRIHHVSFTDEMSWEEPLRISGIIKPESLRVNGTREYLDAANSILSYIIDRHFPAPGPTDFAEVAVSLGVRKLRDSDLSHERDRAIVQFFALVCAADPMSGPEKVRFHESGWKVVERTRDCTLTQAWKLIADIGAWESRALAESDLRKVLGLTHRAKFVARPCGPVNLAVRFIGTDCTRVNEELKNAKVELEPGQSGVDGSGDTVRGELETSWWESIPPALLNPPHERGVPRG